MTRDAPQPQRSFIFGCQRSGTTLLRFLFGAHPEVTVVDEAAAYPVLAGRRALADILDSVGPTPSGATPPHHVYKVPRLSEQLREERVDDDTYGVFDQFYRGERSLFTIRDPRDVVASMCTLKASHGQSWIERYGRVMIEHRLRTRPDALVDYGDRVETLRRRNWPPHLTACLYWLIKNEQLDVYIQAGLPILPLRYEELVEAPAAVLQRACRHLGITWHSNMLQHEQTDHDQLDAQGLAIGASDPRRAIDASSVGSFRARLETAVVREVEEWTGDRFRQLRYLAG